VVASTILSAPANADVAGSQTSSVDEKKVEKVRFGGFGFDFTMADSSGLNAVGENYRNELNFYFEPHWDIGARWLRDTRFKTFTIGARFSLTQPLSGTDDAYYSGNTNLSEPPGSCSGATTNQNGSLNTGSVGYCHPASNDFRTDYSDIWLTIRNPRIYTIPKLGVHINPSIRFILPASKESLFQTLQFALTPSLSLSRSFYKDHINLAFGVSYTKNFHKYKTPGVDSRDTSGSAANPLGGNPYDGIMGAGISNLMNDPTRSGTLGGVNVSQGVAYTINGGVQFNDKWSLDALYIIRTAWAYGLNCSADGYDLCANGDAVAANSGSSITRPGTKADTQILWVTLGYQPVDWVGLSLMWINWAPLKSTDGASYRQGIISTDYNAFTTLSLSATFSLDKIANRIWKPGPKPLTAQTTGNGVVQAKR
jgi:hypothetical protein